MYPTPSITRSIIKSSSSSSEPSTVTTSHNNHNPEVVVEQESIEATIMSEKMKSALKKSSNKNKNKPPPKNNNRSVRFYNSCKMKPHMHFSELTYDELDAAFYKPDDYKSFKLEVKRTAKMIEMKIHIDENNDAFEDCYCTRGTEHRTSEGSRIRSKLQRKARNAVFKEQLNQYFLAEEEEETESTYNMDQGDCYDDYDFGDNEEEKFDIYDEVKKQTTSQKQLMLERQMANIDKLAAVYSECVRSSVMSAYMTGLSDEMTAYEISLGGEYYNNKNDTNDDDVAKYNDDDTECSVVSSYSTNSTSLFQRHPELLKQKLDNIASALLRFQRSSYHQQTIQTTQNQKTQTTQIPGGASLNHGGPTTTTENTSTRKIYSSAA